MKLFDAYIVVDWSASARPVRGRNSVWVCLVRREGSRLGVSRLINAATRAGARALLRESVRDGVRDGQRTFVGWDFALGFPAGFAAALGHDDDRPCWRAVWDELSALVEDDDANANNRFDVAAQLNRRLGPGPGPFWGAPAGAAGTALTATRRGLFDYPYTASTPALAQYRRTEERLRSAGRQPQSVWKLGGRGAVGSQTLLGIPTVAALRDDPVCAAATAVWPFETGFSVDRLGSRRAGIVHAEVWPGAFDLDLSGHDVRDAAQVLALARHLALLDGSGRLSPLLGTGALDADEGAVACREEGWIVGV